MFLSNSDVTHKSSMYSWNFSIYFIYYSKLENYWHAGKKGPKKFKLKIFMDKEA